MKLLIREYEFIPSEKKIYFEDDFTRKHPQLNTESFLLITNITTGDTLYQFNEPTLGGSYEFNTLTLTCETSGMSTTDKLQIFVDIPPAFHIQGDEGELRGGTHTAPVYVVLEDLQSTFNQILKELKKMNYHLDSMTDLNLKDRDLDGDI